VVLRKALAAFFILSFSFHFLSSDQALPSSIKQSTQQRGKEEQRERTQVWARRGKPKVGHKLLKSD
jgi:hypothetical protein